MENISKFLSMNFGYGCGSGSGSGSGYGDGSGDGCGDGCGCGCGYGSGSSYGCGYGSGSSYGYGYGPGSSYGYGHGGGSGYGSGYGGGDGCGYGYGYGDGVVMFNSSSIYYVDGIPSIIKQVKNNIAKGFTLNHDLTLTPCYIARIENSFAHASTIKEAVKQASAKAFQELPIEKRIEEFWKCHNKTDKYLAHDLWIWHNKLTGSCEMGRNQFVAEKGIDLDKDSFTVQEFVDMCKNHYGGKIISQLMEGLNNA